MVVVFGVCVVVVVGMVGVLCGVGDSGCGGFGWVVSVGWRLVWAACLFAVFTWGV